MSKAAVSVGEDLQEAYDEFYSDDTREWRELGASSKADNIMAVVGGMRFERVLDCGAGEGSVLQRLATSESFGAFVADEISDSGISQLRKRNVPKLEDVRKFDGYVLPFADGEFDLAYCTHVLEHVEHPRILLREIRRVSRQQVFEVPLDYRVGVDERTPQLLAYGHINVYTPTILRSLLRSEGFLVLADRHTHTSVDAIRFNWYRNMNRPRTLLNEIKLRAYPWVKQLVRLVQGPRRFREFGYSNYTCLTRADSGARAFGGH